MRHPTWRVTLIVLAVLVATSYAPADTVSLRLKHADAEDIAGCLTEIMARVAPQLGVAEEDLAGLSALPVPERNEVTISGPTAAVELAQKLVRALDIPATPVWLKALVIRTPNPADILRLPENAATVQLEGKSIRIPYEALGIERPIPRDLPTLVCVPNPHLAWIDGPDAGHRVVSAPGIMTLSGQKATVTVGEATPGGINLRGHEVSFVPSLLPDGSISVVLTLYHKAGEEQADEIELAYVARDGEPWAFALLPAAHEEGRTTVFVVTVSTTAPPRAAGK